MSDPTRIIYSIHDQVPSTADLLAVVTRDRHLVLDFSADFDSATIRELIDRIEREVPENYSVFNSGRNLDGLWITIKQVVCRTAVMEMEKDLLSAAKHFRRSATELALALAVHNRVEPERLWEACGNLECHSAEWELYVHGQHCCFVNRGTGQTVEISMWFGMEFGVLDPYFFYNYIRTTPQLELPQELRSAFHDTSRAMEILEERGNLVRVSGICESTGVTALNDPESEYIQEACSAELSAELRIIWN